MKRRHFIAVSALAAAVTATYRAFAAVIGPGSGSNTIPLDRSPTFAAWLDTLLPGDDFSPPASEIDLPARIAGRAAANDKTTRFLQAGTGWLDAQARTLSARDFAALGRDGRERIATAAETAPHRAAANRFFRYTHSQAMKAYYTDPRSWSGTGYSGPPQPTGFPDFAEPPSGTAHGR